MRRLIAGGLAGLRRHFRLAAALLGLQLAVAAGFGWVVFQSFRIVLGDRPIFRQAVDGDLAAAVLALRGHWDVLVPLIVGGVVLAVAYGAISFPLAAGLIGRFRDQGFAATAARRGLAFFRLWLWALVPSLITLGAAFQGGSMAGGDMFAMATRPWAVVLAALPGLVGYALIAVSVDLARVALVDEPRLGAGRAFLRGMRRAFGWPALHYLGYALLWWGVSLAYVWGTLDAALGAGALFLIRQAVIAVRWLLRFATTAGQVAWTPLERQVLERGEVVERPEAGLDLVGAQAAHPVEGEVLDTK